MSDKTWRNGLQGRLKSVEVDVAGLTVDVADLESTVSGLSAPVKVGVATFTAVEMQAMGVTTGPTIVAGVTGHSYLPIMFSVSKSAGTAFTIGSATQIGVGHPGIGLYVPINTTGLLDSATLKSKYRHCSVIAATGDDGTAYLGKALGLFVNAGALTGGSSVTVRAIYWDFEIP